MQNHKTQEIHGAVWPFKDHPPINLPSEWGSLSDWWSKMVLSNGAGQQPHVVIEHVKEGWSELGCAVSMKMEFQRMWNTSAAF